MGHCMSDGNSVESRRRQPSRAAGGPGNRLLTGQNPEERRDPSRVQNRLNQSRGNNHIGEQHQAQVGAELLSNSPIVIGIGDRLESYRERVREHKLDDRGRIDELHTMEHDAYGWYAQNKVKDIEQGNETVVKPDHDTVIEYIKDVERERITLVKDIVKNGREIYIPGMDQMSPGEQQQVKDLWSTLTTGEGTGYLKVEAEQPDSRAKVHACYLQLLLGAHGRDLLAQAALNGNNPTDFNIVIQPENTLGQPAASPDVWQDGHRRVQNQGVPEKTDRGMTQEAINATERGPGTGSTIPFGSDAYGLDKLYAYGEGYDMEKWEGPYELMPEFVQLGHELGHAIRFRNGESTVHFSSEDINEAARGWDNDEEQQTINNYENAIRRDHGLGKRLYHATPPFQRENATVRED